MTNNKRLPNIFIHIVGLKKHQQFPQGLREEEVSVYPQISLLQSPLSE